MKKFLVLMAWASGLFGLIMMLLGVISNLAGGILWNHWWANYFYPGGVFVVFGIFLFMGAGFCEEKK